MLISDCPFVETTTSGVNSRLPERAASKIASPPQSGLRRIAMKAKENFKGEVAISDDLSLEQVEKIRQRAYELYEARGRENGHEIDDWLQAEAEAGITKSAQS
jgi:Protein of unknown function (DUF2934)